MKHRKTTRAWSPYGLFVILACGVLWAVPTGIVHAQEQTSETKSIADLINDVKQGQFGPLTINRLADAGAKEAVPVLKKQFAVNKDTYLKAAIASVLVRLGAREATYWDFLAKHARAAVENDAPSIFLLDSQGNILRGRGKFSPEFTEWAKAHKLDATSAAQAQVYELPGYVTFLGMTGDHRAQPLLRRGLASHNALIQSMAAKGLAKLQDKNSIPLIIDACSKTQKDLAALIAPSLVFFDDLRAQSAAEKFILNKQTLEDLRRRSHEKGADPFLY
jgi:hypothetical protein